MTPAALKVVNKVKERQDLTFFKYSTNMYIANPRSVAIYRNQYNIGMSEKTLKHIAIDVQNYNTLRQLGYAGQSFNDVLTKILSNEKKNVLSDNRSNNSQTETVQIGSTLEKVSPT